LEALERLDPLAHRDLLDPQGPLVPWDLVVLRGRLEPREELAVRDFLEVLELEVYQGRPVRLVLQDSPDLRALQVE